jgi:cytochrome c
MSSIEINKIVGAILLGGFVLLVSSILAGQLVQPRPAETAALALPHGAAPTPEQPAQQTIEPVSPLLASADVAAGEAAFRKCAACHTIDQGGPNRVGPNLWGVVGAPHGHIEGFAFSNALTSKPGNWEYEALNAWLHAPRTYAPGNKMAFPGVKDVKERANLIAYMRQQSDSPPPLPDAATAELIQGIDPATGEPVATAAEEPTSAADGETSAAEDSAASTDAAPAAEEPPATEADAAPTTAEQTAALPAGGLADLLRAADPAAGEKVAAKCKACHTFEQGGANKVGPNLWDIVGAKHAHLENFNYSDAMKGIGGPWTYEALDRFLAAPREYAPGTKMVFPGIKNPEDRAALLAYLRSLSDSPQPLP